jgi:hypothetical protein
MANKIDVKFNYRGVREGVFWVVDFSGDFSGSMRNFPWKFLYEIFIETPASQHNQLRSNSQQKKSTFYGFFNKLQLRFNGSPHLVSLAIFSVSRERS